MKMILLAAAMALPGVACGEDAPNEGLGEDPASEQSDIGNQCTGNGDCGADACIFAVDENGDTADYGYCSGTCESFSDCPSFWNCETVGNATAKYCVQ